MIRCIIIEDEPLAIEHLKRSLAAHSDIQIVLCFDDPEQGLAFAKAERIDVVFLDVHLHNQNGLQAMKKKAGLPPVIVISANSQYALQGFDLDVCDYLLKPYTQERLAKALDKLRQYHLQATTTPASFMVKTETRFETVYYKDLICIEGMGDYRRIITHQRKIMTLQTFKEMEDQLDPQWIVRIHKSYMVQLKAIVEFNNNRVTLMNGQQLPVSDSYKKMLKERLVG
jgi:two-component system, LytTR family, response regulator